MRQARLTAVMVGMALAAPCARPQSASDPLTETGRIDQQGRSVGYIIRHLPPSSFPELPTLVAQELNQRGCLIPQTYEAHQPENVVRASLEHAGSADWAVLCSAHGTVSLLVFFASEPQQPTVLATAQETARLQPHDLSGTLGFNWGLDPASPSRVHQAQASLEHRPPRPDHDALADSVVDGRTIYRFFTKGRWTLLDMPPD